MSNTAGEPASPCRALLAAAGLTVNEVEAAGFEAAYPGLRSQADSLYLPFLEAESPSIGFSAAFPTTGAEVL